MITITLRALFGLRLGFVALALVLSGCTSIDRSVSAGRNPAALKEVFVVANLNDNHGLARRFAAAFRARGLRAESGPLTMLPPGAEAVVNIQDRWAWDFGEHLIFLQVTLSDIGELRPYATATRQRNIARSTNLDEVVPELVAELLAPVREE